MKNLLFFILVINSFLSKSQTPFSGIVIEQNSNYKAIPNVQVKSGASNTISSDVKGNFNLLFQYKTEGAEIFIQAEKAGYEIVNAKEMATKIPKRQTNPFRIVMCKAGLLAQNRAKYYEISEKHITQKYEKKLAKLNRSTEDWRRKAEKLEENYRSSLEFARELADRYSMMNLDDISELQRKAFRLYEENRVDEALKILEGESYQENIKQIKAEQKKIQDNTQLADNKIAKAEEVIQQQISKLMFQADLYAQDFQFDNAERTYEVAVEADTSNFHSIFMYLKFLINLEKFSKSKTLISKLSNSAISQTDSAEYFSVAGVIEFKLGDYSSSKILIQKSVDIGEKLYFKNSILAGNLLGNSIMTLGALNNILGDTIKAIYCFDRSLKIRLKLCEYNESLYIDGVASSWVNLGVLYQGKKDYNFAFLCFNEALNIKEKLYKKEKNTFSLKDFLEVKIKLANLIFKLNKPELGNNLMIEVNKEIVDLKRKNQFLGLVVQSEYNKSLLSEQFRSGNLALNLLMEQDSIISIIEKRDLSESVNYDSAINKFNIAKHYFSEKSYSKSLYYGNEALKKIGLLKDQLDKFDLDCRTKILVAKCYIEKGEKYKGEDILLQTFETNTNDFLSKKQIGVKNLTELSFQLGLYYQNSKNNLKAEKYYSVPISIFHQSPEYFGLESINILIDILTNFGNLYGENESEKAIEKYLKAFELYNIQRKKNEGSFPLTALYNLSRLNFLRQNFNESYKYDKILIYEVERNIFENNKNELKFTYCSVLLRLYYIECYNNVKNGSILNKNQINYALNFLKNQKSENANILLEAINNIKNTCPKL